MNNYLIVDAITNIDIDIVEEYLAMKKEILSAHKKSNKNKINWKGWATLAACFVLMLSSVLIVFIMNKTNNGSGVQTPDKGYSFGIGEVCENKNWNGSYHSIVFNNVYLTEEIDGQKGYYLVFGGNINTQSFYFRTNDSDFGLDLRMIKEPDYITQSQVGFEPELSNKISEVDLLLNGESGEMNGRFCLVFSIDEQNFELIKNKTPQTSFENDSGAQIILEVGVYWSGSFTQFDFSTADVQYVGKIN